VDFLFLFMQKFLDLFAQYYISQNYKTSNHHLIIMPSKRSVAALKNAFALQKKTLWLPEILDIVSFVEKLSGIEIIKNEEALMTLFKVNNSLKKEDEAFETFYAWGSVILSDFNEIDRFLVDTQQFFQHHKALKELNYFGKEKTEMIDSYIAFWKRLPDLYNAFTSQLIHNNKAYQGLAYRQATKNLSSYQSVNKDQELFFLGFNALNKAEEVIFEDIIKQDRAKIAWDIDHSLLSETHHPANNFISKYQLQWNTYKHNFINLKSSDYRSEKHIKIIPTPKSVSQAKAVSQILKDLDDKQTENTAIVLNDENLISPILNSIPKTIENVNITMGITLNQSPITIFFEDLFDFQKQKKNVLKYSFLKSLFNSELLNNDCFDEKQEIIAYLENKNLAKISNDELKGLKAYKTPMYKILECYKIYESPSAFLKAIIDFINTLLESTKDNYSVYLTSYQFLFTELQANLEKEKGLSLMATKLLFREMQRNQKLSFKGSKTKGLQVMGMLETRLLDFENIIMTSVNEGILPAGKTDNSYITYNLKKMYGLPTHTEKDAIYAYHFFRLLQRAKQVYLIYDNDQTGFNKGDKSRFITYLEVFKCPNHIISESTFMLPTKIKQKEPLRIEKTEDIMNRLKKLAKHGFSPTALTTYISNPIKFYKKYILKVKEADIIEEVINARDYGTVIHRSIEKLYKDIGELKIEKIEAFEKISLDLLQSQFNEVYAKDEYQKGPNRIQFEIAKASLIRFLEKEKQKLKYESIEIIDIEQDIQADIETKHQRVRLKGQIDRIDKNEDIIRIIDLKTGSVRATQLKFDDFEEIISDEENAKVFQTLFYAYVYAKNYKVNKMQAGIISFKNLDDWFMPVKQDKNSTIDNDFLKEFEVVLFQLIDEILDPKTPFLEKESIFDS
jgi:Tfp pilus assembly protein PilN